MRTLGAARARARSLARQAIFETFTLTRRILAAYGAFDVAGLDQILRNGGTFVRALEIGRHAEQPERLLNQAALAANEIVPVDMAVPVVQHVVDGGQGPLLCSWPTTCGVSMPSRCWAACAERRSCVRFSGQRCGAAAGEAGRTVAAAAWQIHDSAGLRLLLAGRTFPPLALPPGQAAARDGQCGLDHGVIAGGRRSLTTSPASRYQASSPASARSLSVRKRCR